MISVGYFWLNLLFLSNVLIYCSICFTTRYRYFNITRNINIYKITKIEWEIRIWIDIKQDLHQTCVIFLSGIHGVWYMGQFGSSIGIWNQYSKIFRTQYFWIFFGINIPNFNSVNLGPFIEVLPIKQFLFASCPQSCQEESQCSSNRTTLRIK